MLNFSTDPEFQAKLDWVAKFIREEVAVLDLLHPEPSQCYNVQNTALRAYIKPLQERVREQGLWACHLGPELGGLGYGQVKLALLNEILGRSLWAPTVFGTAAPDTGNAEILAMFGTPEQKKRYLQPLLDGDIVSCFSMTEPQGGADPGVFTCTAVREGDEWVIKGEKWFSSNARFAAFYIVMAVTDPDQPLYKRTSMILVPAETPGIEIIRNSRIYGIDGDLGGEGYVRYNNVRVPASAMLGDRGAGFAVAQARLGGGRIHHAMRTVGQCQWALEMMMERAASRTTKRSLLGEKQFVQGYIADSWIELQQFRLQVLHTAWLIDQGHDYKANQAYIAGIKVSAHKVFHDIVQRVMHVHGSLGVTDEMPLARMWMYAAMMGIMDGPTEVHKVTIAKDLLKKVKPVDTLFPSEHLPVRTAWAQEKFDKRAAELGIKL
ncbi:MAG: acyl-CoA dehydrogenase family protein [Rhodocyclaceae bacterium]|nr:acyl-CoA dehydrogenase family protein [Rhodocyclaceae bacterium]